MIKLSRAIIIGGAVVLVVVAALLAGTVVAADRANQEPAPRPALHAAVGTTLVKVPPLLFCDEQSASCDQPNNPTSLPVKPGAAIVISLPSYITDRPWWVTVERFDTRINQAVYETLTFVEPTKETLVFASTDDLLLSMVEISVPSTVEDGFGNLISQAVWSVNLLATDYTGTRA